MITKQEIKWQNDKGYAVGKNIKLELAKFLTIYLEAMALNSNEKEKWSAYSMGFETGLAE